MMPGQAGPVAEDLLCAADVGAVDTFGNMRGRFIELRVQIRDKPSHYVLLAVIPQRTNKTIAISCECSWDNRLIWRQEFLDLLKTLRLKKDGV